MRVMPVHPNNLITYEHIFVTQPTAQSRVGQENLQHHRLVLPLRRLVPAESDIQYIELARLGAH